MSASQNTEQERLACLRLIRSENIGIKTFYTLLKYYGSAINTIKKFAELPSLNLHTRKIKLISEEEIAKELEQIKELGAKLLFYQDKNYPYLLKLISDPPPFLTIMGKEELLENETIAIVGSRNASINGINFTKKIANELAQSNFVVVSGLARGIDTAAHQGSINYGTIAVIAGGINNIYPPENEKLYKEIIEKGLLLTENPINTIPVARNFPQRNRIVSGLCMGTIIMEASLKSGSLITARYAAEQGRHVFAVPGFPLDYRYNGTNFLLKQGAILIETAQDIIDHLNFNRFKQQDMLSTITIQQIQTKEHSEIKHNVAQMQELILSSIGFTPTLIDDLIIQHNLDISTLQVAILELELEGKIIKSNNNTITLMS